MRIIHTIIFIFAGDLCKDYFRIFLSENCGSVQGKIRVDRKGESFMNTEWFEYLKKGRPLWIALWEGGEDRLPRQQNPTDFRGLPQCRY